MVLVIILEEKLENMMWGNQVLYVVVVGTAIMWQALISS